MIARLIITKGIVGCGCLNYRPRGLRCPPRGADSEFVQLGKTVLNFSLIHLNSNPFLRCNEFRRHPAFPSLSCFATLSTHCIRKCNHINRRVLNCEQLGVHTSKMVYKSVSYSRKIKPRSADSISRPTPPLNQNRIDHVHTVRTIRLFQSLAHSSAFAF